MSDASITFDTRFDASGFEKGIKTMDARMEKINKEIEELSNGISEAFGSMAEDKIRNLVDKLDMQTAALQDSIREVTELSSMYDKIASKQIVPDSLLEAESKLKKINAARELEYARNSKLQLQYDKLYKTVERTPSGVIVSLEDTVKLDDINSKLKYSSARIGEMSFKAENLAGYINKVKLDPTSSKEAERLASQIEKGSLKAERLNISVDSLASKLRKDISQESIAKMGDRMKRLTKEAEDLKSSMEKPISTDSIKKVNLESNIFKRTIDKAKKALEEQRSAMDKAMDTNKVKRADKEVNKMTESFNKMKKSIDSQTASMERFTKKAISGAAAIVSALAGTAAVKSSTQLAMSLESAMGNISYTLGDSSNDFKKWVESNSKSLGIAESDAYKFGSTYSNLLSSFLDGSKETARGTTDLMKTTSIIASKTGRTYEDVAERIRSGMLGSTEAIEDLGIYTNISMIESTKAFKELAGDSSWSQLDFLTQQQIRLNAILEQSYERYGDTLANTTQTKHNEFIASLKDLRLELGRAFKPIYDAVLPALITLMDFLTQVISKITEFTNAMSQVMGWSKSGGDMKEQSKSTNIAKKSMDNLGKSADKTGTKIKKAARGLQSFDQLNILDGDKSEDDLKQEDIVRIPAPEIKIEPISNSMYDKKVSKEALEFAEKIKRQLDKVKAALKPVTNALIDFYERGLKPLGRFTFRALMDFYERFLVPVGQWVIGEGLPRFITALTDMFERIDWDYLNKSLRVLWDALAPFAIMIGEGLLWFYENVIIPLAEWAIDTLLPEVLKLVAAALDVLREIIEAGKPTFLWIWENFIKPLGKWTGEKIIEGIKSLTSALRKFADWISENQEIMNIFYSTLAAFLTFMLGMYIKNKIVAVIGVITGALSKFVVMVISLATPATLAAIAIVALGAAFIYIGQNWDKLSGAEKAITILGGLAAAAIAAAVAIAAFHASWTVGLAAAAITGSVVAISLAYSKLKKDHGMPEVSETGVKSIGKGKTPSEPMEKTPESATSFSDVLKSGSPLPKLAKGGLIPPRKPRTVIVGDNMVEDEIVSPVSKMKSTFLEAMDERGFGGSNYQMLEAMKDYIDSAVNREMVIVLNEREVARAVAVANGDNKKRTGNIY